MAWSGGAIPTLGITPSFISQLGTQTAQNGTVLGLGQVWQGVGQSFFGSAGQSLVGNVAGSAVNIALNTALGTQVPGPAGFNLTSGANLLASTITPFVTGNVAAGINQSIQQSLKSAGPFGPALSIAGTGLVNQLFGGIGNAIFGNATQGQNFKSFPGGGDEPAADYGGSSYTLTDVVFSLQPANQGPQLFGLNSAINFPKSITTLPFNQLVNMPLLAGNDTANKLKQSAMTGQIVQKAFSPAVTSRNFNTSLSLL